MKIAINTQLLIKNKLEGIGWFTFEVISRMVKNHPEHQFIFIFDRPWDPSFVFAPNVKPVRTFLPSRHPILWYLRFQFAIPRILKKHHADLFVSTDGYIPLNFKLKTYTIIHDIGFVHNPSIQPKLISKYYNYFFPKFAKQADRLGTVSDYSKEDMVKTWNIDRDKIDVIYNAAGPMFKPIDEQLKIEIRLNVSSGNPYFVYVGSINPRKNIEGMLRGFELFKKSTGLPYKLVMVGTPMWNIPSVEQTIAQMEYKGDVLFLGRKQPDELHQIVASARALVLVSFLEGFGIPLVEAMQCDVPLICSNITSMPEVAGEAAILTNPYSDDDICKSFTLMANDDVLHHHLIEKARIQRQKFSWEQSAENLWKGIQKCLTL